jgi:hypothetical protein
MRSPDSRKAAPTPVKKTPAVRVIMTFYAFIGPSTGLVHGLMSSGVT